MPSMGALGAISGAAGGLSDWLSDEMKMQRATKLENLRTANNRETNRLNNDQRHENRKSELSMGHDLSLQQLAKQDEIKRGQLDYANEIEQSNLPTYEDDTYGGQPGQRDTRTNEFKPLSGGANVNPGAMVNRARALQALGASDDEVKALLSGETTQDEFKRDMLKNWDGITPMEEYQAEVDKAIAYAFGGDGGGQQSGYPAADIEAVMKANAGWDEAKATQYLDYLKSQGKYGQ